MPKQPRKPQKTRPVVRHYVKEWRVYRGLSQDQLADRVDKSRGLISQIEIGLTSLTEDMKHAIADALSCAPWDLDRVNPMKEGVLVDITDALKGQPPEIQAEALGFVRGLVNSSKR